LRAHSPEGETPQARGGSPGSRRLRYEPRKGGIYGPHVHPQLPAHRFGTKERASRIPETLQPRLWSYMAGICRKYKMIAFAIGGMDDHGASIGSVAAGDCAGKDCFGCEGELFKLDEGAGDGILLASGPWSFQRQRIKSSRC